ncbi:MAG: hypothetical protein ACLQF1_19860 [Methyloceanibacter sp.]
MQKLIGVNKVALADLAKRGVVVPPLLERGSRKNRRSHRRT